MLRRSRQTALILQEFMKAIATWRYGYDLSRATGLQSGTMYPILLRLAKYELLDTSWESAAPEGRPPRHLYRLTGAGVRYAQEQLAEQTGRDVAALEEGGKA